MHTYHSALLWRSGKPSEFPRLEPSGKRPRVALAPHISLSFHDAADMVRFANEILDLHREVSGRQQTDAA